MIPCPHDDRQRRVANMCDLCLAAHINDLLDTGHREQAMRLLDSLNEHLASTYQLSASG